MNSRRFPWIWLTISLLLLVGTPAAYFLIALPYAESTNDPDGAVAMGGFCIGIVLMPVGLLSLLTLAVWVSRKRQLEKENMLSLNSIEKR